MRSKSHVSASARSVSNEIASCARGCQMMFCPESVGYCLGRKPLGVDGPTGDNDENHHVDGTLRIAFGVFGCVTIGGSSFVFFVQSFAITVSPSSLERSEQLSKLQV